MSFFDNLITGHKLWTERVCESIYDNKYKTSFEYAYHHMTVPGRFIWADFIFQYLKWCGYIENRKITRGNINPAFEHFFTGEVKGEFQLTKKGEHLALGII